MIRALEDPVASTGHAAFTENVDVRRMTFDDPVFLFEFLPAFFALYYATIAVEGLHPRLLGHGAKAALVVLLGGSLWFLAQAPLLWLLVGSTFITILLTAISEQ